MDTGNERRLPKNRVFGRRGFFFLAAGLVGSLFYSVGPPFTLSAKGGSRGIFYAVIAGLGAISALTLAGLMSLVVARWNRIA